MFGTKVRHEDIQEYEDVVVYHGQMKSKKQQAC